MPNFQNIVNFLLRFPVIFLSLLLSIFLAKTPLLFGVQGEAPSRVISASLASDEILWAFYKSEKKTANSLNPLLGISALADDPEYSNIAADVKSIPHRFGQNLESIVSLKPDLILLASFNRPEYLEHMQKMGIPYRIVPTPNSLKDIRSNIAFIGKAVQQNTKSETLLKEFDEKWEKIKKTAHMIQSCQKTKPKILVLGDHLNIMGTGTSVDDLIRQIGGDNEAEKHKISQWKKVSLESLIQMNPDFLLLTIKMSSRSPSGAKYLRSFQEKRILSLPGRLLYATSHHLLDGALRLQDQLLSQWCSPK